MKRQLGIEAEKFYTIHQKLNKLIDNLKSDENTFVLYKELAMANATFKLIHELLKDGIPVEETPKRINGLERVPTSGNEMNCLIHSLLKVGKPELDMTEIEKEALSIREKLHERMEVRVILEIDKEIINKDIIINQLLERQIAVQEGHMLDLGSYDGQELIHYLHETKQIEPNRGVLVYQLRNKKIQCIEPVSPVLKEKQKPYSLFLHHDYHFEAMIEPQKK
jgi:hypothetical protein